MVLNKIYEYKFNRKNKNNYNIKFMNKIYKCITLPFDPYYKWNIDVYKINAEMNVDMKLNIVSI
jgi:hypothetical protein